MPAHCRALFFILVGMAGANFDALWRRQPRPPLIREGHTNWHLVQQIHQSLLCSDPMIQDLH
jgi:hypothetical protein